MPASDGQCVDFLLSLPSNDVVLFYDWAEQDDSAVPKCTCRQVYRMTLMPTLSTSLGGSHFFRHCNYPCVRAEVCGMVVGIICREHSITYEVDDGTAVLKVTQKRRAETMQTRQAPKVRPVTGIPDCYLIPHTRDTLEKKPRRSLAAANHAAILPNMTPVFEVGDIVLCRGKIVSDRDGGCSLQSQTSVRCDDLNAECQHQLQVISLTASLYSKPLTRAVITDRELAVPRHSDNGHSGHRNLTRDEARAILLGGPDPRKSNNGGLDPSASQEEARKVLLAGSREPTPEYPVYTEAQMTRRVLMGLPRYDALDPRSRGIEQPRSAADEACRRELLGLSPSGSPAPFQQDNDRTPTPAIGRRPDGGSPDKSSGVKRQRRETSALPSAQLSRSRDSASRSMREQSKIPDSELTDSYFRLRLQQLINQHTNQDSVFTARTERRFSMMNLVRHQELARIAERLAAKKEVTHASNSTRQIFESAIRKMMQEGYIIHSQHASVASEGSRSKEEYIMVTPKSLLPFVRLVAGKVSRRHAIYDTSGIIDDLLDRLHKLDDRFRYLNRDNVHDAWILSQTGSTS